MSNFFVDSSALAKRYLAEVGSAWVLSWLPKSSRNVIVVSDLAPIELLVAHDGRGDPFDVLVEATLATVVASSARVYRQTFSLWRIWCGKRRVDPLHLVAAVVRDFLLAQTVSNSTRQRQISALRKLARVLALDYTNPVWRSAYASLLLLRTPTEGITQQEPQGHALNPSEANRVLAVWIGQKIIHRCNQALVVLLFLTGLRGSEAAALCWSDLDLDEGVLQVRHGKGDKMRTVAIAAEVIYLR